MFSSYLGTKVRFLGMKNKLIIKKFAFCYRKFNYGANKANGANIEVCGAETCGVVLVLFAPLGLFTLNFSKFRGLVAKNEQILLSL